MCAKIYFIVFLYILYDIQKYYCIQAHLNIVYPSDLSDVKPKSLILRLPSFRDPDRFFPLGLDFFYSKHAIVQ